MCAVDGVLISRIDDFIHRATERGIYRRPVFPVSAKMVSQINDRLFTNLKRDVWCTIGGIDITVTAAESIEPVHRIKANQVGQWLPFEEARIKAPFVALECKVLRGAKVTRAQLDCVLPWRHLDEAKPGYLRLVGKPVKRMQVDSNQGQWRGQNKRQEGEGFLSGDN